MDNRQLQQLENAKNCDTAIGLLQQVLIENPGDLDAYLRMNYLLMNLLVEEDYNKNDHDYYASLLKKYFEESYEKFSQNPKYLFYISIIGYMSEWYFELEQVDLRNMMLKAMELEPDSDLYKWSYYGSLNLKEINQKKEAMIFAKKILNKNSKIKKELLRQGALGEYLLSIMDTWAIGVLANN